MDMTECFDISGTPTIIVLLKSIKQCNDMLKFHLVVCAPYIHYPFMSCDMELHLFLMMSI